MSALALILHKQGAVISGSDAEQNTKTDELVALGIRVFVGHNAKNITADLDQVIVNGAIGEDNPELKKARELGIRVTGREELLAVVSREYQTLIAVSGAHGKSTTTAMIGTILLEAGLQPTIHNGASALNCQALHFARSGFGSATGTSVDNLVLGEDKYFVTEACEFRRSFLSLDPTVAVVTNIDADHLDTYKDIEEIKSVYQEFANKAKTVIKNADCINSGGLTGQKVITFGIENAADVRAVNIVEYERGKFWFSARVTLPYHKPFRVDLAIYGRHNIYNALAAVAVAVYLGVNRVVIPSALETFCGISRRFEFIKEYRGTTIISDYAHHPNEVITTIATAKSIFGTGRPNTGTIPWTVRKTGGRNRGFLLVFQPHTYTRTLKLFNEFVSVLHDVDCVLYRTYSAREKERHGGRAEDLAAAIGKPCFSTEAELKEYILNNLEKYDAIIFTGAGDIDAISRAF